jgi:hypothetical protein
MTDYIDDDGDVDHDGYFTLVPKSLLVAVCTEAVHEFAIWASLDAASVASGINTARSGALSARQP